MPENATKATSEIEPPSFDLPSYQQAVHHFLQDGRYRNLSPRTLAFYEYHLSGFQRFLLIKDELFTSASHIPFVQLMVKEMRDGGLAHDTIAGRIRSCRRFFRFLHPDQKWIPLPLTANSPVSERKLHCFTHEEVRAILNQPDQKTFVGYRDYVIMLVLLDTGIRLAELSHLQLDDVLLAEQSIRITRSKGNKSRYAPIGSTCLNHLRSYIKLRRELPFE